MENYKEMAKWSTKMVHFIRVNGPIIRKMEQGGLYIKMVMFTRVNESMESIMVKEH